MKEVAELKKDFQNLKMRQLDKKLNVFRKIDKPEVPRGGWSKTIRTTLCMPSEVLGKRIGITQSAVIQLEASEEAGTISLASLRKLAGGLECDLVYAIVPKKSLNDIIEEQALRRARSLVHTVTSSMELEGQGISEEEKNRQIETAAKNLLVKPSTGFWDDV